MQLSDRRLSPEWKRNYTKVSCFANLQEKNDLKPVVGQGLGLQNIRRVVTDCKRGKHQHLSQEKEERGKVI